MRTARRDRQRATDPAVGWPSGPPSAAVADLVRSLELTVLRRLDGVLHGQRQGLTPGHGSEPGESREYQPGDDVRRIDWNVTARTRQLHVREQIADRDLEAWLVVDTSAGMRFGTARSEKASIALAAAAAIGFLTARNQNRVGALVAAGPLTRTMPPRHGREQVRAVLQTIATAPVVEGRGRTDLGAALDTVGALSRRRGFVGVIADVHTAPEARLGDPTESSWLRALGGLCARHEVLVVDVVDPRELELPAVGWMTAQDPATGRTRDVRVTPEVQRAFGEAAAQRRDAVRSGVQSAGASLLTLRTDEDWLAAIVTHTQRRKAQVARTGRAEVRR